MIIIYESLAWNAGQMEVHKEGLLFWKRTIWFRNGEGDNSITNKNKFIR